MRSVLWVTIVAIACGASAHAQSLQEQAQGAAQARISANEENIKWETEARQMNLGYQTTTWSYESHYDTKLRKCFVVTKRMYNFGSAINGNTNLYDAFERRDYGLYSWPSRNPHKPMICQLLPTYDKPHTANRKKNLRHDKGVKAKIARSSHDL
jgi:hypothetical protein